MKYVDFAVSVQSVCLRSYMDKSLILLAFVIYMHIVNIEKIKIFFIFLWEKFFSKLKV